MSILEESLTEVPELLDFNLVNGLGIQDELWFNPHQFVEYLEDEFDEVLITGYSPRNVVLLPSNATRVILGRNRTIANTHPLVKGVEFRSVGNLHAKVYIGIYAGSVEAYVGSWNPVPPSNLEVITSVNTKTGLRLKKWFERLWSATTSGAHEFVSQEQTRSGQGVDHKTKNR
tara:strand:- start:379 stop:897 length:519 start_codon:yes stop_codon:yes gene_type:complete